MEATLDPQTHAARPLDKKLWTARILQTLLVLFLLLDAVAKVLRLAPVIQGTVRVGYPESIVLPLGIVLLACTILYAVPRTAVLGAILLTAWLGGATATHARLGEPYVMPVVFGVLIWGCLFLRDARLRELLPFVGQADRSR
jgi:hypothetical protein